MALFDTIGMIFERSGLKSFLADGGWKTLIMFAIVGVLVYLAIVKKFEPLLLLPIAFGMLLTNIPGANLFHMDLFLENQINIQQIVTEGGMLDFLYLGVKLGIYPPLIFLGVGAMTDFSPLIANPKTLFWGRLRSLACLSLLSARCCLALPCLRRLQSALSAALTVRPQFR